MLKKAEKALNEIEKGLKSNSYIAKSFQDIDGWDIFRKEGVLDFLKGKMVEYEIVEIDPYNKPKLALFAICREQPMACAVTV